MAFQEDPAQKTISSKTSALQAATADEPPAADTITFP